MVQLLNSQVSAHDVFQHGTLTAGLTANDDYLGEVDGIVDTHGCEDILELVDKSEAGCQYILFLSLAGIYVPLGDPR